MTTEKSAVTETQPAEKEKPKKPELSTQQTVILKSLVQMLTNKAPFTLSILKDPKMQEPIMKLFTMEILTEYFEKELAEKAQKTDFHEQVGIFFAKLTRKTYRDDELKKLNNELDKNIINRAANIADELQQSDSEFKELGLLMNNILDGKDVD